MKRIGADEKSITFQLMTYERDGLMEILQMYPVLPPAHQPVSKGLNKSNVTEYQRLLDEALAEQRAANKKRVQAWLDAPERFEKQKGGCRLTLERSDAEWLLQVLNDVRVGYWLRLGSPESTVLKPPNLSPKLLPFWLAMETAGYFQVSILEGLG